MKTGNGHNVLMPYLIIKNAQGFIKFTGVVFGAKQRLLVPREEGVIMHAELDINGAVLMLADATEQFEPRTAGMFVYVEDTASTYRTALEMGAKSLMEPTKTEYADLAAGFEDPYGNTWWLGTIN